MATMDELFQKAIKQAAAQKKQPELIPWKSDEPWPQPYYSWDSGSEVWQLFKPLTSPSNDESQSSSISAIAVYSWNIDFMLPFAETRMKAALAHLEGLTSQLASTTAIVINLQECTPSDLITISQQEWVRDRFYITDLDSSAWASSLYGTVTLVDRRLEIASCFRVHYSATQMERDALFVDVAVAAKKVRLGNTHLESLALDPPLRPSQMRVAATYLHADESYAGAVITGDFNAIQPFDAALHADNGLKDTYLELGGREGADDGFTWGQQALAALRERFGCSRMDKAYFFGGGIKLQSFERFGADIEVGGGDKKQKDGLLALGFERAWVTDHLGIKATFSLVNDTRL
ncbi:endonuclease/exonuclease/phosphatase family protein [Durotheca rogersii]|uniref:endonuclease/exonuclease/phosphatase family protein n=1 Tax=Durotheca rogersii TaxID=419775 RepID=UPI00221EAE67|nr:endonuclease/exonuclease/phosphatase family protein [Durotheca rogersii]KAI5859430.1 endonuclease/exonuclease/phosphatase family protein [Durotheca rogersii]